MQSIARALLAFVLAVPALAQEAPDAGMTRDAEARARLLTGLQAILSNSKTATWSQSAYEWKDGQEQRTTAHCWWQAPDKIRMEMGEGHGNGSVAVRKGDVVTGWLGALSFVKANYGIQDKQVLSIRGNSLAKSGFMDDVSYAVEHWDAVKTACSKDGATLTYTDGEELLNILYLDANLVPKRQAVYEAGKLVQETLYKDVRFNAQVSPYAFE